MRCSSLLSCGLIPLWEAVAPRLRERRVAREQRAFAEAELAASVRHLRRDNREAATPTSWAESPPPPQPLPPRPRTPPPGHLTPPGPRLERAAALAAARHRPG